MSLSTSSEFFINMKSIPDSSSQEYDAFFKNELDKIENGFTVNGVHIDGWLYWHTNHWKIHLDVENKFTGKIKRSLSEPLLRDNEWMFAEYRAEAIRKKMGLCAIGTRRFSKALRNDSILYMDGKEITIGEVKEGDKIYGADGKLTTVIGVFPQGIKDIYKVSLLDGREIYCCEDHLWKVFDKHSQSYKVIKLKEILPRYRYPRIHNGYKDGITRTIFETRYSIPNNNYVEYSPREITLDPYFLGQWLGDGGSRDPRITTADEETLIWLKQFANSLDLVVKKDDTSSTKCTYLITTGIKGGHWTTRKKNTITTELRKYNLITNKHIPSDYKYNSFEVRLALLQGLMDSAGTVSKRGDSIYFSNSNEKLVKDVYDLVRSMGISASIKKNKAGYKKNGIYIPCKDSYSVIMFTELPIFRLTRKLNKCVKNNKGRQSKINKTSIVNIELIGKDYATCITVDNKDHLFLTDNYTPTHNSEIESSIIGRSATIFEGSENVISAGNDKDLKLIADKIDKGLNNVHPYFRWSRIENNWGKQVTLGIKDKEGNRIPWSSILPRNLDDGNNTEAVAGITAFEFIIDEIGKFLFLRCLEAGIPAFTSPFGWRCSPLLVGTGGSFDKGSDAEKIFNNPEGYNFLAIHVKDEPKSYGLFLPGTYRMEAKEECKLGEWLAQEKQIEVPLDSEIYNLSFQRTNQEKAQEIIKNERETAKKANDQEAYLKAIMYYPLTPDECFLTASFNIFNAASAVGQKKRLEGSETKYTNVWLVHDGENIKHEFSDKKPISTFPYTGAGSKDAPIQMWEAPIHNPPFGLYVAGVDPYRQGKSEYSTSLGAVYIYKRMHDITGEKFQDMFVASYVARPNSKDTWHEQARLLIKYYNARTLVENDEISFIDYMKSKGDARYLESQPQWLREVVPNTTMDREFGISRASQKVRDHLHNCLKKYLDETIKIEKDENGSVIREILGVNRIFDTMLLEEIIKYNETGNFDRIIAAELAIAMAHHMDPMGKVRDTQDERLESLKKISKNKSIFSEGKPFFGTKHKTFR